MTFITRHVCRLAIVLTMILAFDMPGSRALGQTRGRLDAKTITLGIVSEINQKEIEEHFQPFVRYVASGLSSASTVEGRVVVVPTLSRLAAFLTERKALKGKASLVAQNADIPWSTPWDGETVLQVFIVGFFFMGQIFVPLVISVLPIPRPIVDVRLQAFSVLVSYLLVAFGALLVLYFSLKPFFPLPEFWFRFRLKNNWFLWGLGRSIVRLYL